MAATREMISFEELGSITLEKDIEIHRLRGTINAQANLLEQAGLDIEGRDGTIEGLRKELTAAKTEIGRLTDQVEELVEQLSDKGETHGTGD